MPVDDATVDVDADAAGLGVPVGGHAGDRGVLRRALTRGEVDPLVTGPGPGDRVDAVAEGRGHLEGTGDRVTDVPVSQRVRGDGARGNRWHLSGAGGRPVGGVDLGDSGGSGIRIGVGLIELGLQVALSALQRRCGCLLLGGQLGDLITLGLGGVPSGLGIGLSRVRLGLESADPSGGSILPGLTIGVLSALHLRSGEHRLLDPRTDLNS